MTIDSLAKRRARSLAPGYRLFYDDPVHLVRGEGVWVWDNDGNKYLDCYNNVPSVGHCHPRVVEAIAAQAATLNTHTRYLHSGVVTLAERLGERLGGNLTSCWLVCSGTEANDLAIQVARAATGNWGVIVTKNAYHGNSTLVRLLSTELYSAKDRPQWLEVIDAPNTYRGPFRGEGPDVAESYAAQVSAAVSRLAEKGLGLAAFLVDSSWDSNGVLVAPADYLTLAAKSVHDAGGLVVADEVQSGYCRLGQDWWGHRKYGVTPDIVTMGKPMGAGHPVAACVTTPEIAGEFAQQTHYFNTFGGNPVSAAAANAVLDVIDSERLLDNATETGELLGAGLTELSGRHEIIGNVQGSGLFWGLDLVSNRETKTPLNAAVASALATALRHKGVLMGVTGPHNNILKIRPPLPFNADHTSHALEVLDQVLGEVGHDLD